MSAKTYVLFAILLIQVDVKKPAPPVNSRPAPAAKDDRSPIALEQHPSVTHL